MTGRDKLTGTVQQKSAIVGQVAAHLPDVPRVVQPEAVIFPGDGTAGAWSAPSRLNGLPVACLARDSQLPAAVSSADGSRSPLMTVADVLSTRRRRLFHHVVGHRRRGGWARRTPGEPYHEERPGTVCGST